MTSIVQAPIIPVVNLTFTNRNWKQKSHEDSLFVEKIHACYSLQTTRSATNDLFILLINLICFSQFNRLVYKMAKK